VAGPEADGDTEGRALAPGHYLFEDLAIGDHWPTGAMTLTESQFVAFAGLSGDFFDLHMDDDYARELGFPSRVAHGILGLALLDGLKNRADVRLAAIVSLGWDWNFRAPLLVGDRIRAHAWVSQLRPTSRPERGFIELTLQLTRNGDAVAQEGVNRMLIRRRAG